MLSSVLSRRLVAGVIAVSCFQALLLPGIAAGQSGLTRTGTGAQSSQSDSSTSGSGGPGTTGTSGSSDRNTLGRVPASAGPEYTADQIITVLQKNPQVLRELRDQLIAEANKRGMSVNPSELTDAAMFRLIRQDARIRSYLSNELQQRGLTATPALRRGTEEQKRIRVDNLGDVLAQPPLISNAPAATTVPGSAPVVVAPPAATVTAAPTVQSATAAPEDASSNQLQQQPPIAADTEFGSGVGNPYPEIPALKPLYEQVNPNSADLQRFGADIFRNGTGNLDNLPMDLPVGPDYVLGAGDSLGINLWGTLSDQLERVVDRQGIVSLPEVGIVPVAGRTLADAQRSFESVLAQRFRGVHAAVSLTKLRTIRVYVVGDVERPGAYDISSLSTPLNALYAAGGPTTIGSMRVVQHYRGKQLVQEVDLYDLILKGIRTDVQIMQSGDTLLVPPAGPTVTVEGMVRRPAIYELHGEQSLAEAIAMAGGVLPTGTLRHLQVGRVEKHVRRTMLSVNLPEREDDVSSTLIQQFKMVDGDVVQVSPILPYRESTVYVVGHVVRPGKHPYHDGMKVADLIASKLDLLPEASSYAEIVRLSPPEFRPEVIAFHLDSNGVAANDNLELKPFDTVRIFSRYRFEDVPVVTVEGEVRKPGERRMNGDMHLRDAIYLAGGLSPDANAQLAQVYRKVSDSNVQVLSINLARALEGDALDNVLLQPRDKIVVHRNLAKVDPPTVFVQGEVVNPGEYPLGLGLTAADLVKMAGGFTRSAFTETADLARYRIENGSKVLGEQSTVAIGKAIAGDESANLVLRDGDVLAIREITGWHDIGASATIRGELVHPGTFGIHDGERLSSLLRRAGGFRPGAYPRGIMVERQQVRELAEKTRTEMIEEIENQQVMPTEFSANSSATQQAALLEQMNRQRQQVVARLKKQPANGRLLVNITTDIGRWENTAADIELRSGDVITVPKKPTFVLVSGEVFGPAAITYAPGRKASWYLQRAGGATDSANRKEIFIVRADGTVVGHGSDRGFWKQGGVLSYVPQPGDAVVVPEKVVGGTSAWKHLMDGAQVMTGIALVAKVASGL